MAVLDVYQALREDRPYRRSMNHNDAMKILISMAKQNKFNKKIVEDIDEVFTGYSI